MDGRAHEGWVVAAAGDDTSRRFAVPEPIDDVPYQPWVLMRPMTAREALRREAIGLEERYELGPDGAAKSMTRTYDHDAMTAFELECCLLKYELPMRNDGGATILVGPERLRPEQLLDRLPAGLMSWLHECLDIVNMRTKEAVEVLAEGKGA